MALESLTNSDCSYHDLNHTIMVTDVGQSILWGRLTSQGDVTAHDWLHAILAMLYHDVGFIRGILKGDRGGRYIVNEFGDTVAPPAGATDAYMAPYHVSRSCLFVKERFATETLVDAGTLIHHIEMTRFPVPRDAFYQRVGDFAGLVRAADLIGQMADPQYIQKLSKLFMEFTRDRRGGAARLRQSGRVARGLSVVLLRARPSVYLGRSAFSAQDAGRSAVDRESVQPRL